MRGGMIMPVPVVEFGSRVVDVQIPDSLRPGDEFYIGGGKERRPTQQVTHEQTAGAAIAIQGSLLRAVLAVVVSEADSVCMSCSSLFCFMRPDETPQTAHG